MMRKSVLVALLAASTIPGGLSSGPAGAQGWGADCAPVAVGTPERFVRLETGPLAIRRGAVFALRITMTGTDFQPDEFHFLRIGPSVFGGGVFDPAMGFSQSQKEPAIRFVVDDSLFAELIEAGAVELVGADEKRLRVALVASELSTARECIDRHTVPMIDASDAFQRDPISVLRLSPDQEPTVRAVATSLVYPPADVPEGREGTTVTRLTIGASGRVTGCEIARSSGWSDLDAAACAGLSGWIYHPATDGNAVPVSVPVHQPVTWKLDQFRQ